MDKDTKIIFIILAIIAVLIGVFIFKVVKTNNKKDETTSIEQNQVSVPDSKNDISKEVKYEKEKDEAENSLENFKRKRIILTILLAIISYMLQAIAIYKLSEQERIGMAWLAFIPYVQWILVAMIGFEGSIIPGIIYITVEIASIFIKNKIITWISSILFLYILYRLFAKYSDISKFGLGKLIAIILVVMMTLYVIVDVTGSFFALTLATYAIPLTSGLYLFLFSRKITE